MAQHYESSNETSKPRPRSYQARPRSPDKTSATSQRPRPTSNVPPDASLAHTQPINDAVSSAVNSSIDPSSRVDPDLVAQITEQVINSLRLGGVASPPTAPLSQVNSHSSATNPPTRDVNTPPSPDRPDGPPLVSAIPLSHDSHQTDGYIEEPRASQRSPEHQTSSLSDSGLLRPVGAPRIPTDDTTTLEKIWRPLFTPDGSPTARLGQFLQGLAIHIIEDFEPLHSIVIPPHKMQKFYEAVKVPDEIYPWDTIFGGTMTNSSLSHLYRDLACQHHFVQSRENEKPHVPALTPAGFATWMAYVIRAHPETEYNRFAKAVLNMPISNADDAKERFPKELSRRLFPRQPDLDIQMDLEDAMTADPVIELTPHGRAQQQQRAAASPTTTTSSTVGASGPPAPTISRGQAASPAPLPPTSHTSGLPQAAPLHSQMPPPIAVKQHASMDKERQQYSTSPVDVAVDELVPTVSIERERKPYYAQPGGGKVYDEETRPPPRLDQHGHPRAYSTASGTRPAVEPADEYHVNPRIRTNSMAAAGHAPRRRYRSPSASENQSRFSRSETDMPPNSYSSNTSNFYPEYDDEGIHKTYSRGERARRYRNDEPSRDYGPLPPPPPPPPAPPLQAPGGPPRGDFEDDVYWRGPAYNQQYPPPPPRY